MSKNSTKLITVIKDHNFEKDFSNIYLYNKGFIVFIKFKN